MKCRAIFLSLALLSWGCVAVDVLTPPNDLALMESEARSERVVAPVGVFGPIWCGISHLEHREALTQAREAFAREVLQSKISSYLPSSFRDENFPLWDMSRNDYERFKRMADVGAPREEVKRLAKETLSRMERYRRYKAYMREKQREEYGGE